MDAEVLPWLRYGNQGRSEAYAKLKWSYCKEIQSKSVKSKPTNNCLNGVGRPIGEGRLIVPKFCDSRPCLLIWSSKDTKDPIELIQLRISSEQRSPCYHLGKDTTDCPDINRRAVIHRSQQNLRCSIPEGNNLLRVRSNRDRVGSRQSKVSNLKVICVIDKLPLVSRRMFAGFRSRWMIRFAWQSAMPASI